MRPLALLAAALALGGCAPEAPAPPPERLVVTQTVVPGGGAAREVYSGEVRARHETDLAFRIGGKLAVRAADAGARVSRGQVLARLDPEDAALAARAARAQLAAAEGDLGLAAAELERHRELLARKFISPSAFDARQNAFNAARARAEQARAQAQINANQAGYTALVAEADGVVISVAAEPGQVLAAGQPVLRLAQAGAREVVINVPESRIGRFRPGQAALVSLWADPQAAFPGRVREIAGGADPVTRTYALRVAVPNAPAAAQLGMTANVLFDAGADPAVVMLPLAALTRDGERAAVWIVDPATRQVRLRHVTVGQYREDGASITAGLHPGDVVVTAGVHKLRPGETVRIAER